MLNYWLLDALKLLHVCLLWLLIRDDLLDIGLRAKQVMKVAITGADL